MRALLRGGYQRVAISGYTIAQEHARGFESPLPAQARPVSSGDDRDGLWVGGALELRRLARDREDTVLVPKRGSSALARLAQSPRLAERAALAALSCRSEKRGDPSLSGLRA